MLLLPETLLDVALLVAERIRAMIDQSSPEAHYAVSIGVTTKPLDSVTLDAVLV